MKQYINNISLIVLFFLLSNYAIGQQTVVSTGFVLKESLFDFGKIPQGKPVFHVFDIKNTGKSILQITDVQASCGCTTPVWQREAVQPGGTTQIKVGYNAAEAGNFEKTITVFYGQGETMLITIKGDVWRTPDQPAPSNKSISFLKKLKISQE
ncbi:MAG: hypothetical protein RL000_64 [Bacteroidota bacterium]